MASKRDDLVALYNAARLEGNTAQEEHFQSLIDDLDVFIYYLYIIKL